MAHLLARCLAHGVLEPLLDQINVVIVPRTNPDGAETGTRSTAKGVDIFHASCTTKKVMMVVMTMVSVTAMP